VGIALGLTGGRLAGEGGYLGGHLAFGLGAGVGARGLERPADPPPAHASRPAA
jgi:hypothetical protein